MTTKNKNHTLLRIAFVLLSALSVPGHLMPQSATTVKTARVNLPSAMAPAPNVETMNRIQFRALPPNTMVAYKGRAMAKADFISQRRREIESLPKVSKSTSPQVPLAQMQAEFVKQQESDLATQNLRILGLIRKEQENAQRLATSPQYAALSNEARDLASRFRTATPTEKAKIKQRAQIVYDQLVQIERSTVVY